MAPKHDSVRDGVLNSSVTGNIRNSSVELLRLIAMFMITYRHAILENGTTDDLSNWMLSQPVSFNKYFFQIIVQGGGWVGNVIFFTISAWFLLDRQLSTQSALKRIWLMEREILFWSLTLFAVTILLHTRGLYEGGLVSLGIKSLLPLSFNLWWYPTSFALFLLFLPYLSKFIHTLGKKLHAALCVSMLLVWALAPLIPHVDFNYSSYSVFTFIYIFIIISYYKMYMKSFAGKTCVLLIFGGLALNSVYWAIGNVLLVMTGKAVSLQDYLILNCSISEIMIGIGIFLLFEKVKFHSRAINAVAGSAFGIYLIHMYPGLKHIWPTLLPFRDSFSFLSAIPTSLLFAIYIYCCCLTLDLCRQGIFFITVNRHKGKGFNQFYAFITHKLHRTRN